MIIFLVVVSFLIFSSPSLPPSSSLLPFPHSLSPIPLTLPPTLPSLPSLPYSLPLPPLTPSHSYPQSLCDISSTCPQQYDPNSRAYGVRDRTRGGPPCRDPGRLPACPPRCHTLCLHIWRAAHRYIPCGCLACFITSFPGSHAGEEGREPGTHCLRMWLLSMFPPPPRNMKINCHNDLNSYNKLYNTVPKYSMLIDLVYYSTACL